MAAPRIKTRLESVKHGRRPHFSAKYGLIAAPMVAPIPKKPLIRPLSRFFIASVAGVQPSSAPVHSQPKCSWKPSITNVAPAPAMSYPKISPPSAAQQAMRTTIGFDLGIEAMASSVNVSSLPVSRSFTVSIVVFLSDEASSLLTSAISTVEMSLTLTLDGLGDMVMMIESKKSMFCV